MPERTTMQKLNSRQVERLKGKLLQVRRVGASPIFIEVTRTNTIRACLKKADVPIEDDMELKIEARVDDRSKYEVVKLGTIAFKYSTIVVTTKVEGA